MARLSFALLAALLLLTLAGRPRTQDKADDKTAGPDAVLAGNWKVILPMLKEAGTKPVWLVKLQKSDKGWSGEVLARMAQFPKATVEGFTVTADQAKFTLKTKDVSFPCTLKLSKEGKGEKLYGTATLGKSLMPMELEKTTLTSLDGFDQLKESLAKQPLGHEVVSIAITLLSQAEARKATPAEVLRLGGEGGQVGRFVWPRFPARHHRHSGDGAAERAEGLRDDRPAIRSPCRAVARTEG